MYQSVWGFRHVSKRALRVTPASGITMRVTTALLFIEYCSDIDGLSWKNKLIVNVSHVYLDLYLYYHSRNCLTGWFIFSLVQKPPPPHPMPIVAGGGGGRRQERNARDHPCVEPQPLSLLILRGLHPFPSSFSSLLQPLLLPTC